MKRVTLAELDHMTEREFERFLATLPDHEQTRQPRFWAPLDENETWPKAIAAAAVFVIVCIALYLWVVTAGAVQ